uniref:hypothetical protein n=1 Tax=Candidatus Cryptobacteroides bacterium TaxID=3085639 RepID=UPI0040290578
MKSNTIIPLLVTLFATIGCSNNKEYNYGIEYMHGNVKSVDLSVFEAKSKFGEVIEDEYIYNEFYSFNAHHQIEQIRMIEDELKDSPSLVLKFKYGKDNNLHTLNVYNSDGEIDRINEFQYSNGKIKKCDSYECYNDERDKYGTLNFSYSQNQMIVEMIYDHDKYTYIIDYNDKGRTIRITLKGNGSNKNRAIKIERDKDENILKTTNIREELISLDHVQLLLVLTMEPSLGLEYIEAENIYLYEYEFDEHHNWIKRIVYENDKEHPQYIYKRSIEYYE